MGGASSTTNNSIQLVGTNLFLGGNFTSIQGTPVRNIARWNGSSWQPLAAGAAGEISTTVSWLTSDGTNLIAAGDFIRAGSAGVLGIAKWNGVEWSALNGPNTKGLFLGSRTMTFSGTNLILCGSFNVAGGIVANKIARWDGSNWNTLGDGLDGNVSCILENGGNIYVGGTFTNAGGVSARRVARWDGFNWTAMGAGFNSNVAALVVHNGEIYAGGTFSKRGDNTGFYYGIAKWNGSDWLDLGQINAWRINNAFNALASDGVNLYAGGNYLIDFSAVNGGSAENIARWDGSFWNSMGNGLSNTVNALALGNGILYAGGSFTNSGALRVNRMASWNGSAWSPLGNGFTNGPVSALAISGSTLFAGGSFTNVGTTNFNRIAKWDGSTWTTLGSGLTQTPGNASVTGLALDGENLYVAGLMSEAGGKPSSHFARWNETIDFGPLRLLNANRLPSGEMNFQIAGFGFGDYFLDASTNLTTWEQIHSGDANDTNFTDAASVTLPQRFYRLRKP
jgi:hypothetical protein